MPEQFFTIPARVWTPPPDPEPDAEDLVAAARGPRLTARWVTAEGEVVGDPLVLTAPPPHWIEFPDAGGFGHEHASPPVSFMAEQPAAAAALQLADRGRQSVRIHESLLMRAAGPLPPPLRTRIGPGNARLVIPVFSERFAAHAAFVASVQKLRDWILDQPPFDQAQVGAQLAFEAHFWPSDTEVGRFDTPDSESQGGRLFHGNRTLARQLLDPFVGAAATSLILINSTFRGGAGGVPGFSAWSSIAELPGEPWQAVCLHELGHGLGLADEYLDDRLENEEPQGEPNVSREPKPSRAPWRSLVTLADQPSPSFTLTSEAGSPAEAVGTFQGARYRKDLFRPSRRCLMRDTRETFCAVCCEHLIGLTS